MNYIKIFQNTQALSVSVGNTYPEDQLMHIVLDKFHQGGTFYARIANHQVQLRREGKFTDQIYIYIYIILTD